MYPHDNSCWKLFSKEHAPKHQLSVLPVEWSSAVLNCISDANTLYDAVFEGQAVCLDFTEAFQV